MIILDGAMGTELERRGVDTSGPAWSARAVIEQPDVVREVHKAYVEAGADVMTACTFRATKRGIGTMTAGETPAPPWEEVARKAVALAKEAAAGRCRVAGSIAPLADCWHPERSPAIADPAGARREHAALAGVLADAGCDLLLCETFPNVDEGLIALSAAVETGLESWLSLTPGYREGLLGVTAIGDGAAKATEASAVLVNCAPAESTRQYVDTIRRSVPGPTQVGAFANARREDGSTIEPHAYAALAATWIAAGASIIGGCCYTTPAHIAAMAQRIQTGGDSHVAEEDCHDNQND